MVKTPHVMLTITSTSVFPDSVITSHTQHKPHVLRQGHFNNPKLMHNNMSILLDLFKLRRCSLDITEVVCSSLSRRRGIHGRIPSTVVDKEPRHPVSNILSRAIEDDYAKIRSQYRRSMHFILSHFH